MSPIVWNGSARSMMRTLTPQLADSPYVSSDSTLRHAGAQQCWHNAAMYRLPRVASMTARTSRSYPFMFRWQADLPGYGSYLRIGLSLLGFGPVYISGWDT